MTLFIVSFIAGVLTVLAPCILPLLPVILGGAVADSTNRRRPLVIISALVISVFVFTLLLKGSTALITVAPSFWTYVSATILIAFGLTLVFPNAWARLVLKIPGHNRPDRWLSKGYMHPSSFWADVLIGAALGPVFTTCSPTFFVILATVLPQSLGMGIVDLLAYIMGLALILFLVAWVGQKFVDRLEWATDPNGWFKRTLGVLFIVVAVLIASGTDKKLEANILAAGFFDVTTLEQKIHQILSPGTGLPPVNKDNSLENSSSDLDSDTDVSTPVATTSSVTPHNNLPNPLKTPSTLGHVEGRYVEIVRPDGFVNSAPFKLADIVGRKVILIDFIDYSCINCERTFPFLNDWYSKYKDQGLEIVAIHTPEFSFEKDIKNVTMAAEQFKLKFPIVLDNNYDTWNAYSNQYWPHKYLIDIHGNVIFDHVGEGNDDEVERNIVAALNERKKALNEPGTVVLGKMMPAYAIQAQSPETYFGALRNRSFGNGTPGLSGNLALTIPANLDPDKFYLGGKWKITDEYAETSETKTSLAYVFTSAKVYLIAEKPAGASGPVTVTVLIDGKPVPDAWLGTDVTTGGVFKIDASRLYNLYTNTNVGRHRLDIIFSVPGIRVYTFTFG